MDAVRSDKWNRGDGDPVPFHLDLAQETHELAEVEAMI
jgi:hypothetical protein